MRHKEEFKLLKSIRKNWKNILIIILIVSVIILAVSSLCVRVGAINRKCLKSYIEGGCLMQGMMGFGYLSIVLGFIKIILEVMFYIAAIFVAFKTIQALNVYINKNSR